MDAVKRRIGRATEPQVLFPLIAALLLAGVWAMTTTFIKVRQSAAVDAAVSSGADLLDTYEAQVVRALRDIDQALMLVRFWHARASGPVGLAELRDSGLLPPDLLYIVSVANAKGIIVESTRSLQGESVADQDYFKDQRDADSFIVGRIPRRDGWDSKLRFSRRLLSANGQFDGVVIVAVDADYFVSGYETSKLGEHGVLGLLATDGFYRVKRSGDSVSYGDGADYAAVVGASIRADLDARITNDVGDAVPRWVRAREIYSFPLAAVVGLSVDEQLAAARHDKFTYLTRAGFVSVLIVLLSGLLGRLSWQLMQSRLRERENSLAHAERVEYLAFHDGLTGLPNRSMFSKLLNQSIAEARRYSRTVAVAFLDLDRFKQINDSLGHEAGDHLLKEIAIRLRACVRESDIVARLGGDEFVVVLPEVVAGVSPATVAQKILTVVARPFTLLGQEFRITVSIGISSFPQDGVDEQTLTKNADIAMYQAKEAGKNAFRFYARTQDVNSLERLTLEAALRHALARDEFRLFYQAKRDIASGRVTGMEALLRWQHPDLGLVEPSQFLQVAEASGLTVPIGKWVLKTACLQNIAWQRQGLTPLGMAVNLTARQFHDERLTQDLASILQSTGMEPRLLELEFTEGLLIQDVDVTLRVLSEIKALGIRIAIDNFGTGYSTLATLQRFPLDTIKIDRSLIRDLTGPADDTGLASAIIAIGRSLSATVVAQGVETRDQAEFLRTHACDELQGFYFERPLPVFESTRLLLGQEQGITYIGKRLGLVDF